jgi:hypothetical protein
MITRDLPMRLYAYRVTAPMLAATSLLSATNAQALAAPESFALMEQVHANTQPLGYLTVCVRVSDARIKFSVSMPDSGQILQVDAPVDQDHNGVASFHFDDDGWGNAGRGTFERKGQRGKLFLEQTGAQPGAIKNIRRNYGEYALSEGACIHGDVAARVEPLQPTVVSVHYVMRDRVPEHLVETVTLPVERVLSKLERMARLDSTTTHGIVDVEAQFEGETTAQDLATVVGKIDQVSFGDNVQIISRTVELRPARIPRFTDVANP